MFVLTSDITIGKFRFSGVYDVRIKRSIHSYADTAVIKIPKTATVQQGKIQEDGSIKILPGTSSAIVTGKKFKDGEPVIIKLGYNGELKEEFRGFVKRRKLSMPLEVECEGYVKQLRLLGDITGYLKETSARELLQIACGIKDGKGKKLAKPLTDITVVCQVDMPMHNIKMIKTNGAAILDEVKKISLGTLAVFFIEPTVLWCGFTYTPYREKRDPFNNGIVKYRLGFNCIKDSGLKERVVDNPVQVILNGMYATGKTVQTAGESKTAKNKEKTVSNNIQDEAVLHKMATERQYRLNYAGYEGALTGFLQPFCLPGYKGTIIDNEYPERNGDYMVESVEVRFGVQGARRIAEIGPLVGFDPDKLIQV